MARVTQAHLDARRAQILDAARRCFLRNGFHTSSMNDVLSEAGLSAGAVYRYFSSKDQIIAAIAEGTLASVSDALVSAVTGPEPVPIEDALERILAAVQRLAQDQGIATLAIQVWAEALRVPAVSEQAVENLNAIRGVLTDVVRVYQEHGAIDPDTPSEEIVYLLVALIHGFLVHYALTGDANPRMIRAGLHALIHKAK